MYVYYFNIDGTLILGKLASDPLPKMLKVNQTA